MDGEALLLVAEYSRDVAVLQWPKQEGEREMLERLGLPRLLVLDGECEPPPLSAHCLEDWTRTPVEPGDLRARLATLAARSRVHCTSPLLDVGWGQGEATSGALRIHLTRLRRRLGPLGLEINSRRGVGHVLNDAHAVPAATFT